MAGGPGEKAKVQSEDKERNPTSQEDASREGYGSLDTTPTCISSLKESSHRHSVVVPRGDPLLAGGASSKQQGPGGVSSSSLSDSTETDCPSAGYARGVPRLLVCGLTCMSVGLHGVGGALEAFGAAHGACFVGLHVGKRRFLKNEGVRWLDRSPSTQHGTPRPAPTFP